MVDAAIEIDKQGMALGMIYDIYKDRYNPYKYQIS